MIGAATLLLLIAVAVLIGLIAAGILVAIQWSVEGIFRHRVGIYLGYAEVFAVLATILPIEKRLRCRLSLLHRRR
jgi:hypothetical protein